MYGMLTQDIARTVVADREREISRMAIERAAGDSSAPRLHERLIAAASRLRAWNPGAVVRPSASAAGH